MKKLTLGIGLLLFSLPLFQPAVSAADIVTIDPTGRFSFYTTGQVAGTTNTPPGKALGQENKLKKQNPVELLPVNKRIMINPTGNQLNLKLEKQANTGTQEKEITSSAELDIEPSTASSNIKIQAHNNAAYVIRNKIAAQTHFPLMVNLETNELIVTTPKGSKVVTILPDQAVAHMLAANVLDQAGGKGGILWLEYQKKSTSSATLTPPSEATGSPTPIDEIEIPTSEAILTISPTTVPSLVQNPTNQTVTGETITLTQNSEGTLIYEIPGIKKKKLLGIWEIILNRTAFVSAETGELIKIQQDTVSKIADLISTD